MDLKNIKLIVFDFDGVIEDNYELHYQLSKIKTIGLTREEHRKLFEGNIHLERAKLESRNTNYDIISNFNYIKEFQQIEPLKIDILTKLSKKYKLGIISSSPEKHIIKYLENNNIASLFDFVYGLETHKLKIDKFNIVIKKYKYNATEIIFVTDTLGDILEAEKLNIKSIAVDFGYHERTRLEKGNPIYIVSSYNELYNLL